MDPQQQDAEHQRQLQQRRLLEIARLCVVRDERKAEQNEAQLQRIVGVLDPGPRHTARAVADAVLRPHVFIYEGDLVVVRRHGKTTRTRHFWLFNDCLIEATAPPPPPAPEETPAETTEAAAAATTTTTSQPRYVLRRILSAPVALVLVGDEALGCAGEGEGAGAGEGPASFIVLTAEKRYTLRATSRASAAEWAAAFRMVVGTCVSTQHAHAHAHAHAHRHSRHRAHAHAHHKDRAHGHARHAHAHAHAHHRHAHHKERTHHRQHSSALPDPVAVCDRCGQTPAAAGGAVCAQCGRAVCLCAACRADGAPVPDVCHFCHLVLCRGKDGALGGAARDEPWRVTKTRRAETALAVPCAQSMCFLDSDAFAFSPPLSQIDSPTTPDGPESKEGDDDDDDDDGDDSEENEEDDEKQEKERDEGKKKEGQGGEEDSKDHKEEGDDDDDEGTMVRFMDASELPVVMHPSTLTFGGELLSVDVEATETVTLANRCGADCRFRFLPQRSSKCRLVFEPLEGTVPSMKARKVRVKLTMLCTAPLALDVVLLIWCSRPRACAHSAGAHRSVVAPVAVPDAPVPAPAPAPDAPSERVLDALRQGVAAALAIRVDTRASAKLDGDEVCVCAPAVGSGTFGTVYRGVYRGQDVAVKVLKNQGEWARSAECMEAFQREVRVLERLHHPCVVRFVGGIHRAGDLAIVTEFCPLGSLSDLLKQQQGVLAPGCALRLKCVLDCADGMAYLHHHRIVHRDLKPKNLLVVSLDPAAPVVCKISDFGSVKVLADSRSQDLSSGVGSVRWMAPEVILHAPYGMPADVYSFAIVLYETVCAVRPYLDPVTHSLWDPQDIAAFVADGHVCHLPSFLSFLFIFTFCFFSRVFSRGFLFVFFRDWRSQRKDAAERCVRSSSSAGSRSRATDRRLTCWCRCCARCTGASARARELQLCQRQTQKPFLTVSKCRKIWTHKRLPIALFLFVRVCFDETT